MPDCKVLIIIPLSMTECHMIHFVEAALAKAAEKSVKLSPSAVLPKVIEVMKEDVAPPVAKPVVQHTVQPPAVDHAALLLEMEKLRAEVARLRAQDAANRDTIDDLKLSHKLSQEQARNILDAAEKEHAAAFQLKIQKLNEDHDREMAELESNLQALQEDKERALRDENAALRQELANHQQREGEFEAALQASKSGPLSMSYNTMMMR